MNLFDKLVTEALKNRSDLIALRAVVEKELLHHDILRIMRDNHFVEELTFIGGTCLRYCYGGIRLSEDLDFTGGKNFSRDSLSSMGQIIRENLENKYGLKVAVSEPIQDKQNVDTWKIKIETRPGTKNLPTQRINIDICNLTSYEKRPMMLINPYGIDMGTSGLIIQSESREEIFADKLLAFAFRPNRIKYRDIWDMIWLHGQGIQPRLSLIPTKLADQNFSLKNFLESFNMRLELLKKKDKIEQEFHKEMLRFLPLEQIEEKLNQKNLWDFVIFMIEDFNNQIMKLPK